MGNQSSSVATQNKTSIHLQSIKSHPHSVAKSLYLQILQQILSIHTASHCVQKQTNKKRKNVCILELSLISVNIFTLKLSIRTHFSNFQRLYFYNRNSNNKPSEKKNKIRFFAFKKIKSFFDIIKMRK